MGKLLYFIGMLTLTLVVSAAISYPILLWTVSALTLQGKDYVAIAVPAITTSWSRQQLLDRATPELRDSAAAEEASAAFARFAELGPLVECGGVVGSASISYVTGFSVTVSASYEAKAHFENGDGTIRIALRKVDGRWMIQSFFVDAAPHDQINGAGTSALTQDNDATSADL